MPSDGRPPSCASAQSASSGCIFWQVYFDAPESSKRVRTAELEYIRGGQAPAEKAVKVPWTLLLRYRDIWPFLIGKLITDPVWWFYLFWLPSYLENERDQPPLGASIWIAVIYLGRPLGRFWADGFRAV